MQHIKPAHNQGVGGSLYSAGALLLLCALCLFAGGCGLARVSSNTAISAQANADAVCGAQLPEPLTWGAAEQRYFRAAATQGPVVVSKQACRVVVLHGCRVAGVAGYLSDARSMPHQEQLSVDLRGQARVGLPWVDADVDTNGELHASYTVSARSYAELAPRTVLQGACAGATHIVTGYSTGASELKASTAQRGSVDNSVVNGQASASAGILTRNGDLAACLRLAPAARGSAIECSAVVQLELAPLQAVCAGHNCQPDPAAPGYTANPSYASGPGYTAPSVASPGVHHAAPAQSAPSCAADLAGCGQRCQAGDRRACEALGSSCSVGLNLEACQLYWNLVFTPMAQGHSGQRG